MSSEHLMNPFDTAEQIASLWGRSGDALLDAQRHMVRDFAGWIPTAPPDAAPPSRDGDETARRAFARSWEAALEAARAVAANLGGATDPELTGALDRTLDPRAWFARTAGHEPGEADKTMPAARLDAIVEARRLVQRRALERDVVLVEAWMQAAGAFARALDAATRRGAGPVSPGELDTMWSDHADPIFAETERSEAFRRARARWEEARRELDTAQRALGEITGAACRADLEALRVEVEALRRRLDDGPSRPAHEHLVAGALERAGPSQPTCDPAAAGRPEGWLHEAPPLTAEPADELDGGSGPVDTKTEATASLADGAAPESGDAPAGSEPEIPAAFAQAERPARYVVERAGDAAASSTLLAVGPPGEVWDRGILSSLAASGVGVRCLAWPDAAADGSLDDLVRDLAAAWGDLEPRPAALLGIGTGGILAACLAARVACPDGPLLPLALVGTPFDLAGMHGRVPGWLAALARANALLRGGLAIAGETLDMAAIRGPILNLVVEDGAGRAEASRALAHLVGSDDYAERPLATARPAGDIVAAWLADRGGSGRANNDVS